MKLASGMLIAAATLSAGVHGLGRGGALVVYTPSVPVGLYWRSDVTEEALVRGAYVCLHASSPAAPEALRERVQDGRLPRSWASVPLVKRIAAVAGDRVEYNRKQGVLVDGRALAKSVARTVDSKGRTLPSPPYPVVVEEGQVWLSSEHEDGCDSRYFGPIDSAALSCVAEPLWTW